MYLPGSDLWGSRKSCSQDKKKETKRTSNYISNRAELQPAMKGWSQIISCCKNYIVRITSAETVLCQ